MIRLKLNGGILTLICTQRLLMVILPGSFRCFAVSLESIYFIFVMSLIFSIRDFDATTSVGKFAHSFVMALVDKTNKKYYPVSLVDPDACLLVR